MAKLYFYYSAMNAGKTTTLVQSAYNYRERGMNTLVLKPEIDERFSSSIVRSRIGLETDAINVDAKDDLFLLTENTNRKNPLSCVLLDEAQFLTKLQVFSLGEIVDRLDIPVLAYGLRSDFRGELFEGSLHLLAWADELVEIKTICHCGKKAGMVLRLDGNGNPVSVGDQVKIGGNDIYVSVCRKHFKKQQAGYISDGSGTNLGS
jgi:thymidine kinase